MIVSAASKASSIMDWEKVCLSREAGRELKEGIELKEGRAERFDIEETEEKETVLDIFSMVEF